MSLIDTEKTKKRKLTKKQIKTAENIRELECCLGLNSTDEEGNSAGPSAADDYLRSLRKEEEEREEEWMLPRGTFLPSISEALNFVLEDSPFVPEASPSAPEVEDSNDNDNGWDGNDGMDEEQNTSMEQLKLSIGWKEVLPKLVNSYFVFRGDHQLPTVETKSPSELKCFSSSPCLEREAKVTTFFFLCKVCPQSRFESIYC